MPTARFLGFDLSTTVLAAGVTSAKGEEDFVSVPMKGAVQWEGQPAFALEFLPDLLMEVLGKLQERGWDFSSSGALSFSVRQHDMAIIWVSNEGYLKPLMPALSWQCNAATTEVEELQESGDEEIVGKIEPRFILPKLMWVLKRYPAGYHLIEQVMTTGDYIALMLTGSATLSTSDALSNGLLNQQTKDLAIEVFGKARLKPSWFPKVIQSGEVIGSVFHIYGLPYSWEPIRKILSGWRVVAGLGDNHAGGVGCGLKDYETVVISGGSSGTVIRKCRPIWPLQGKAACFEYYDARLLLMMLADCTVWYERFVQQFGQGKNLAQLDKLALEADLTKIKRVFQEWDGKGWKEMYPENWDTLTLAEKVASTQASIAVRLLLLVREMLQEVLYEEAPKIKKFVITGGLSKSAFFQQIFSVGLPLLVKDYEVFVSNRKGPLANKSAALGAMINAMVGAREFPDLTSAIAVHCPLKPAPCPDSERREMLANFIRRDLL